MKSKVAAGAVVAAVVVVARAVRPKQVKRRWTASRMPPHLRALKRALLPKLRTPTRRWTRLPTTKPRAMLKKSGAVAVAALVASAAKKKAPCRVRKLRLRPSLLPMQLQKRKPRQQPRT